MLSIAPSPLRMALRGCDGPLGRSLTIAGALQVLRVQKYQGQLVPATGWTPGQMLEIWGVVTPLIRQVWVTKNPTVASGVRRSLLFWRRKTEIYRV